MIAGIKKTLNSSGREVDREIICLHDVLHVLFDKELERLCWVVHHHAAPAPAQAYAPASPRSTTGCADVVVTVGRTRFTQRLRVAHLLCTTK